jgi:autotransporter passenger strand-loop-strand repeat protein
MAVVSAGGLAVSATINNTGIGQFAGGLILSGAKGGGTASGAVLNAGGQEVVFAGGTDISGTINSGGQLSVLSGGKPPLFPSSWRPPPILCAPASPQAFLVLGPM